MKDSFGGTEDDPMAGHGQGSGFPPGGFSCLGSLIINAYRRMGHGAWLTSSKASHLFLLAAAMYVDHTDLIHWADCYFIDLQWLSLT